MEKRTAFESEECYVKLKKKCRLKLVITRFWTTIIVNCIQANVFEFSWNKPAWLILLFSATRSPTFSS